MPLLSIRSLRAVALATLSVLVSVPAGAATVYHWETEDGTFAYTDDPKRIPARYEKAAERRTLGRLTNYKRYTPSGKLVSDSYAKRLGERLTYLRGASAPAEPVAALVGSAPRGVHVRIDLEDLEIDVPGVPGAEPVVVEEVRTRPAGQITTRTVQVVRQGDQILAVIKPDANESDPSQVIDERDLK